MLKKELIFIGEAKDSYEKVLTSKKDIKKLIKKLHSILLKVYGDAIEVDLEGKEILSIIKKEFKRHNLEDKVEVAIIIKIVNKIINKVKKFITTVEVEIDVFDVVSSVDEDYDSSEVLYLEIIYNI